MPAEARAGGGHASEEEGRGEGERKLGVEEKEARIRVGAANVDTTQLDDMWIAARLATSSARKLEAPKYISDCAAYQVDATAAEELGSQYAETMDTLDQFFCMAYQIDPRDRQHFTGRG